MDKRSFIHRFTKILVDVMFYGGIAACLALPFMAPQIGLESWLAVMLGAAGVLSVFLLYQLKKMFKTLLAGDPFVQQNVDCLQHCGVVSFWISILFLIRIIIGFTFAAAMAVVIFALLGLFALTLKDVFKQAVVYKEETDGTV